MEIDREQGPVIHLGTRLLHLLAILVLLLIFPHFILGGRGEVVQCGVDIDRTGGLDLLL